MFPMLSLLENELSSLSISCTNAKLTAEGVYSVCSKQRITNPTETAIKMGKNAKYSVNTGKNRMESSVDENPTDAG